MQAEERRRVAPVGQVGDTLFSCYALSYYLPIIRLGTRRTRQARHPHEAVVTPVTGTTHTSRGK